MSSEQPRRGREGGSGASPIGSTAAIVIAVIAVVGGFLILRQINDDDDGGSSVSVTTVDGAGDGTASSTTIDPSLTTLAQITTPTTPAPSTTTPKVTEGAVVVVANASTVDGAAGRFTTALQAEGFTTGEPTNGNSKVETSVVYYDASSATAKPVADYLATLLGGIAVEELPTPAPVNGGVVAQGTTVLLVLGSDKADKTLVEAGAPTTTVAGAGSTTIPAGGTTTIAGA